MGSFSWMKADTLTSVANICYGEPFKFLIPKEFGGGFIKDRYQDYGNLGTKADGSPKYNIYELLVFWNAPTHPDLRFNGEFTYMKEVDEHTDHNRTLLGYGGRRGGEDGYLKYQPKLVSCSFKGTYEDCEGFSYSDPNQGYGKTKRTVENSFPYLHQQDLDRQRVDKFIGKIKNEMQWTKDKNDEWILVGAFEVPSDLWQIIAPAQDYVIREMRIQYGVNLDFFVYDDGSQAVVHCKRNY